MAGTGPGRDDRVAALEGRVAGLERSAERAEERAVAIQAIAAAVGSSLELDEVLQIILDKVTELLDADRSTLFLLTDDRSRLRSVIAQGTGDTAIEVAAGEGLAGWVARTGRSLSIKDAYQDPRFIDEFDRRSGFKTRSVLCVPMRNLQRRILGVVEVLNKRGEGWFSPSDERLLAALAGQAAVTIENAKLYSSAVARNVELMSTQARLERKLRELDALFEVEQEIARAPDLDSMLTEVLGTVTGVLEAEAGSVLLLPEDGRGGESTLAFRAAVGPARAGVVRVRLQPGEGIIGYAADRAEAVRVPDVDLDPRHSRRIAQEVDFPVRDELAAPLMDGDRSIGAVGVLNRVGDDRFTDEGLKLLQLVAGQVARAIVRQRHWDEQERQDRLATIGRMLSGLLHDLKTPMTIISGYVQLMARKEDPEERARYAGLVRDQFGNMADMTREVLKFARGDSEALIRKVFLNDFVESLREGLERQVEGRGIDLCVEAADQGAAWFDETKVRRAVQNLVRNAIEAMPEGGRLAVRFGREGDAGAQGALVIEVQDSGPGIPEEIRDVLFESFVTTGKQDGTGLGLAIVKRIAEDHGGSITFTSPPGRGATFVLRLPQTR